MEGRRLGRRLGRGRAVAAALVLAVAGAACGSGGSGSAARPSGSRATSTTTAAAGGSSTSTVPTSAATLPAGDDTAIERVVDGDTVVVTGGVRVRLIGVDTPETKDPRKPVQCFGREASARTAALLPPGTAVRLVYDVERTDRYGRTLAYVYRASDGLFVNASLVRDGYAVAATFPPDVAHADEFVALTREAREAGRGLWAACGGPGVPASG